MAALQVARSNYHRDNYSTAYVILCDAFSLNVDNHNDLRMLLPFLGWDDIVERFLRRKIKTHSATHF